MSRAAHNPAGPSLTGRFAAAIALTIGFYVLALVIAGGLIALAIVPWFVGPIHANLWLTVALLVVAGSIFPAIMPRRLHFTAPGVKVTASEQPRLLALVEEEAKAAGEPMPDDVYLTLEANAAVTQASRTRRVLIVGVPLLHILSESELRGVLAHEFGHYSGGDTRLGPWIYRTRETIERTVEQLSAHRGSLARELARWPFIWYGRSFLKITAAISRRQEFAADARAARNVGRATYVGALERIHAFGPGFDYYWRSEVAPVLEHGRRPPISAGFRAYIGHSSIEQAASAQLEFERTAETDPYDSHPPLSERIAALEGLPEGEPDRSECSYTLLAEPARVERDLLEFLFGAQTATAPTIEWDAVGREVYAERARQLAAAHVALYADAMLADLPDLVAAVPSLATHVTDSGITNPEQYVATVLGDAVIAALAAAGWTITANPAEPVIMHRGEDILAPHQAIADLATERLDADAWRERVRELGIADLPLGAEAPKPSVA